MWKTGPAWWRQIARGIMTCAACYLFLVLALMALEETLVYPRGGTFRAAPGLEHEDFTIESSDGVRLHAWFCPCPGPVDSARPVVLFCHGNGGELTMRAPVAREWQEALGADVLLFDYRGFGRSTGHPTEVGLSRDAHAAYDWLIVERGIEPDRILLVGRSLGGAVAIRLASEVDHRALVLQSTFTSLPDVAASVYPWVPVHAVMRNRWDSAKRIGWRPRPVFVSHGERDEIIPTTLGRRLFELANEPKQWFLEKNRSHNDPPEPAYYDSVRRFLEIHCPGLLRDAKSTGMLKSLERKLVYAPTRFPEGDWHPEGVDFEDVELTAEDGVRLHAWYCRGPSPTPDSNGAVRPVLLYAHGNAGNLSDRAENIRIWQSHLAIDFLIFDYRGYGKSDGDPSEQGLYRDSRAAYRWLLDERGVPPERIVLFGRSLGGAVAMELALAVEHCCMILESTFTSLPDIAALLYPLLPVRRLLTTSFDTLDRIDAYRKPLLVTHGDADSLIPYEHAERLFEQANEPKSLLRVPGADHNCVAQVGGKPYFEAIAKFLRGSFPEESIERNRTDGSAPRTQ